MGKRRPIEKRNLRNGRLIEVYPSIRKAAEANYISAPGIIYCAQGLRRQAGGYRWKYADGARKGERGRGAQKGEA